MASGIPFPWKSGEFVHALPVRRGCRCGRRIFVWNDWVTNRTRKATTRGRRPRPSTPLEREGPSFPDGPDDRGSAFPRVGGSSCRIPAPAGGSFRQGSRRQNVPWKDRRPTGRAGSRRRALRRRCVRGLPILTPRQPPFDVVRLCGGNPPDSPLSGGEGRKSRPFDVVRSCGALKASHAQRTEGEFRACPDSTIDEPASPAIQWRP